MFRKDFNGHFTVVLI